MSYSRTREYLSCFRPDRNLPLNPLGRMDDASFREDIAACEQALDLMVKYYIPVHGPSGGAEVVEPFCKHLKTLYNRVSELYDEGLSDFEMKDAVVANLSAYQDWSGFSAEVGKHIILALLEIERAEFE